MNTFTISLFQANFIPKIKTCVTNINVHEADKIADLAKELDVSFSYSPLVIPRLDFGQDPGNFRIAPDAFLDISKRFRRFARKKEKETQQDEKKEKKKKAPRLGFWERDCVFNCMAGRSGIFINPYGKMLSCMTVPEPAYDIFEFGAKKCWEKVVEFVHNVKPPKEWECYKCEVQDWCSWCPGRGILNTGDIFGCPPYFKELAQERQRRYLKAVEEKKKEGSK
jgi:radical SAM protein with 4Fe4S-binding SPASM domain